MATPPKIFDYWMFVKYFKVALVRLGSETLFENGVNWIICESWRLPSMMNQMKEYVFMLIIKLLWKTISNRVFLSPKSSGHLLHRTCFSIVVICTVKTLKLILNLLPKRSQKLLKNDINFTSFFSRWHTNSTESIHVLVDLIVGIKETGLTILVRKIWWLVLEPFSLLLQQVLLLLLVSWDDKLILLLECFEKCESLIIIC